MRYLCRCLVLAALVMLHASPLLAQLPLKAPKGQPAGGDSRGSYYDPEKKEDMVPLYKDPKLYLENMTLLAHLDEASGAQMMTIGDKRYMVGRVVTDVTDPKHPVVVNRNAPSGQIAWNQKHKKWILLQANSCCAEAVMSGRYGKGNGEMESKGFLGATFWDMTDPAKPVQLGRFDTGGHPGRGVHGDGNYYDGGRYAYVAASVKGTRAQVAGAQTSYILMIIDVDDLMNPKEAARFGMPGQWLEKAGQDAAFKNWPESKTDWNAKTLDKYHYAVLHGPCYVPKRLEDGGTRGYCSWSSLGMVILDLTNVSDPKIVSQLRISPPFDAGIPVHDVYPMLNRKLAFIQGEIIDQDCLEGITFPWVVDIRNEQYPITIATFPIPKPPKNAPYSDFCMRGGRFGTHNPQAIKAPGEGRPDLMGYTWFAGGFRLYDISNPFRPEEVAWMVPPQGERRGTEQAFIEWDRKIIHVFSDTGHYILSSPVLGEPVLGPMKPTKWNIAGMNEGAP